MTAAEVAIRAAQASDLPGIVRCHLRAFPGQGMTELGPTWLTALYRFHMQHADGINLVAVDPTGSVLGFVVGGEPRIRGEFLRTAKLRLPHVLAWRLLTRPVVRRKVLTRLKAAFSGTPRVDLAAIAHREAARRNARLGTLLSIAVLPEVVGSPVAGRLLEAFCRAAADHGFGYLELGVYHDNPRAIAFYHKHGWQEIGRNDEQLTLGFELARHAGRGAPPAKEPNQNA